MSAYSQDNDNAENVNSGQTPNTYQPFYQSMNQVNQLNQSNQANQQMTTNIIMGINTSNEMNGILENNTFQQHEQGFIVTYHHRLPHEQRLGLDGSIKNVALVVKQSSFLVVIQSESLSLEGCSLDCTLLYDNEQLTEVNYINQKPISFNSFLNSQHSINIELKLLVLSSQHEDMLFRIRFDIHNPQGQKIVSIYSEPIRVISKADHKRKGKPIKTVNPKTLSDYQASLQQVHSLQQNHQHQQTHQMQQIQQTQSIPLTDFNQLHSVHSINPVGYVQSTQMKQSLIQIEREGRRTESKAPRKPEILKKEGCDWESESTTENMMQLLEYQQQLLKEMMQKSEGNPLIASLTGLLSHYSRLPQQQRMVQLMRLITELPPEELNIMNELVAIFREYKHL